MLNPRRLRRFECVREHEPLRIKRRVLLSRWNLQWRDARCVLRLYHVQHLQQRDRRLVSVQVRGRDLLHGYLRGQLWLYHDARQKMLGRVPPASQEGRLVVQIEHCSSKRMLRR